MDNGGTNDETQSQNCRLVDLTSPEESSERNAVR